MTNYVCDGERIEVVATEAVTSGDIVLIGSKLAIAVTSAAIDETFVAQTKGVFALAKTTGQAITQGQMLYYKVSTKKITTTGTGNVFIGYAWNAELSGATTVQVLLVDNPDVNTELSLAQAANIAELGTTDALTALVPTAATMTASNFTAALPAEPTKAEVDAGIDALKDKVITVLADKADNADVETLRTEVEGRLDDVEGLLDTLLGALKTAGLMVADA